MGRPVIDDANYMNDFISDNGFSSRRGSNEPVSDPPSPDKGTGNSITT
jgi:hypothetical protein